MRLIVGLVLVLVLVLVGMPAWAGEPCECGPGCQCPTPCECTMPVAADNDPLDWTFGSRLTKVEAEVVALRKEIALLKAGKPAVASAPVAKAKYLTYDEVWKLVEAGESVVLYVGMAPEPGYAAKTGWVASLPGRKRGQYVCFLSDGRHMMQLLNGDDDVSPAPARRVTQAAPAATAHAAAGDYHTHTCPKCGTTWGHASSAAGPGSHNCPKCGTAQYVQDSSPRAAAAYAGPTASPVTYKLSGAGAGGCGAGGCANGSCGTTTRRFGFFGRQ